MTEQEKQLLLIALCGYLPYGVKYKTYLGDVFILKDITFSKTTGYYIDDNAFSVDEIKPYLRPMSSMTEEEILHIQTLVQNKNHELYSRIEECGATSTPDWKLYEISYIRTDEEIDYLNSRHLDYRGLIGKGLAIEAPEGMYNTKTE